MLALKLISRTIDQPLTVDSQVKKHYFCTCRDPSKLIENFFDLPKNYLPKTKLMSFIHTCTCTQSVELIMPPRSRFTQLQNACLLADYWHCTVRCCPLLTSMCIIKLWSKATRPWTFVSWDFDAHLQAMRSWLLSF